MLPEDEIRLRHMRDAVRDALSFARGRERADLDTDRQLLYAIVMAIGIIGEAATHVNRETRERHRGIPWPVIVGMRNRLMHAYFDINRDIVWTTITDDLPPLLRALDAALDES